MEPISAEMSRSSKEFLSDEKYMLKTGDSAAAKTESTAAPEKNGADRQYGSIGDTVTISDEAREKSRRSSSESNADSQSPLEDVRNDSGNNALKGANDDSSDLKNLTNSIERQIREVQEDIKKARERLAEVEPESDEAKSIMKEIEMLSSKLLLLVQEKMKAGGGGSASADGPRSGIGGEGEGPGGQGQRIPINE